MTTVTRPQVPAQAIALKPSKNYVGVEETQYLRLLIENYRNEVRNLLRANARLRKRLEHGYVAEVEAKNRILHAQCRRLKDENAKLRGD